MQIPSSTRHRVIPLGLLLSLGGWLHAYFEPTEVLLHLTDQEMSFELDVRDPAQAASATTTFRCGFPDCPHAEPADPEGQFAARTGGRFAERILTLAGTIHRRGVSLLDWLTRAIQAKRDGVLPPAVA